VKSQPQPDKVTVDAEQVEGMAEQVEKERLELLLQELQNKVEENPQLQKFKDQILFEITPDGLRIQIMDAENRPMFDSGSARLKPYFEDILLAMADTIKAVPNKISISGHTDAKPYTGTGDFGNWELSANRANAARRALVAGSYPDRRWRGSWVMPRRRCSTENPFNPVNRRIDIVVLTKKPNAPSKARRGPNLPLMPRKQTAPRPAPVDPNALPADSNRCRRTSCANAEPVRRSGTETVRARDCGASPRHCTGPSAEAMTDKKADSDVGLLCGAFQKPREIRFSVVHGTDRRCAYRYR
jgi:chemotaxis protein MotB